MKKLCSLVMIITILFLLLVSDVFAENVVTSLEALPAVKEGCYRYFFMMPDDWFNEYTDGAGIYWFEGSENCGYDWPGYKAHQADAPNVYYYDVPKDVPWIIWNNYIDGGKDTTTDLYKKARKTGMVDTDYYESGENNHYPEGLSGFDGMIVLPIPPSANSWSVVFSGEWYGYYGNGYLSGDADENRVFNIRDATAVQKHIAGIALLSERGVRLADFDLNEKVNIKDVTSIQKNIEFLLSREWWWK